MIYKVWNPMAESSDHADEIVAGDPAEAAELWAENWYDNGNFEGTYPTVKIQDAAGVVVEAEVWIDFDPIFTAQVQ